MIMKQHVITATVENQPGVLARIVGIISGRGYNIESLNVAPTLDPDVSRLTMTVPGDDSVLEQVTKQLNKMVDVIKVTDLTKKAYLDRELILVEVNAPPKKRAELAELAGLCHAEVVSIQEKSLVSEEKRFRVAQIRYREGKLGNRDIIEAQNSLLDVKNRIVELKNDYAIERLRLLRTVGTLLLDENGVPIR